MTRRNTFFIGLVFEIIAIFGLFVPSMALLANGTPVTLKTIPVDPYSIFRGQYVTLNYEVGQNLPEELDYGKPVYVVLEQKGDFYERVSHSQEKPQLKTGQVCLRGKAQWMGAFFPDLGQYFVEEGLGAELEKAQTSHRLIVHARVGDDCRAIIESLEIGEEAPLQMDPTDEGLAPRPSQSETTPER